MYRTRQNIDILFSPDILKNHRSPLREVSDIPGPKAYPIFGSITQFKPFGKLNPDHKLTNAVFNYHSYGPIWKVCLIIDHCTGYKADDRILNISTFSKHKMRKKDTSSRPSEVH